MGWGASGHGWSAVSLIGVRVHAFLHGAPGPMLGTRPSSAVHVPASLGRVIVSRRAASPFRFGFIATVTGTTVSDSCRPATRTTRALSTSVPMDAGETSCRAIGRCCGDV